MNKPGTLKENLKLKPSDSRNLRIKMKTKSTIKLFVLLSFVMLVFTFATCKYSFRDSSPIPADITTFRVNAGENKARYVDPTVAPQLT